MNPLWKKLQADAGQERGRLALAWTALFVSLTGTGLMLDAYSILSREITRNYELTRPAHATFEVPGVERHLVAALLEEPRVVAAERRSATTLRFHDRGAWRPIRLFVIDDFDDIRLNLFTHEAGAWPPPTGQILLERSALRLVSLAIDDQIHVKDTNGRTTLAGVAGFVHDAGLAPSDQERTLFAYATEKTAAMLAETSGFDELLVQFEEPTSTREQIVSASQNVSSWLEARDRAPSEVRIPPPRQHPHQGPMNAVLLSFVGFGVLSLLLSALLIATTFAALLAKQTRQIAVLKTLGATPRQIGRVYLALAGLLGFSATTVAVPVAILGAGSFSRTIAELINFNLYSSAVSPAIIVAQVGVGICIPLMAAAVPVLRASRASVRNALDDRAGANGAFAMYTKSRYSQLLASRPLAALAVRNAASRPIRLFLSLSLIAASGAILMSAFNTKESWLAMIDRVYSDRDYDLELKLAQLYPLARISDALSQSAAVSKFEGWQSSPANFHDTNGPPVLSTYPDGGHGSFNIYRIPSETSMVRFPVTEGRWLQAEDSSAIVLNQGARSRRPAIAIGDTARLQTDFGIVEGDVVGFIEEVGSSAAAYMPLEKFRREPSETPTANLLRIKLQHGAERDRESAISEIDAHLAASGILVRSGLPLVELNNAMSAHIGILIATLLSAALAIAIVASLGLSSILSMGVIERRKEFSILRAIGATPRDIMKLVLVESALIGLGGAALALPATLGISWLLGSIVGSAAFQIPLPLTLSLTGIACSSGGTAVIVGLAAVIPARLAARERARQALAAL